jgi:hypothetical protein
VPIFIGRGAAIHLEKPIARSHDRFLCISIVPASDQALNPRWLADMSTASGGASPAVNSARSTGCRRYHLGDDGGRPRTGPRAGIPELEVVKITNARRWRLCKIGQFASPSAIKDKL